MYKKYIISTKFWWTPEQIDTLTFEEFKYYLLFIQSENMKSKKEFEDIKNKK